ncbi:hypothetical protein BKA82DRAFT_537464 [Pisolithus tinctorius]|uniref:Uncharacterized protein n=1 Tax=Pisolithus tinctorius Marx 270 TaxID=870435 RepID=A0A0C3J6N6_PISTI|nr:hypothetical protein BKA82DRAFT_537464 [Pisolithus tinctorius]KIO04708.1 hypothetical protein M404DRAFT_537464 [Pisolithus tinctorius Marx 270]
MDSSSFSREVKVLGPNCSKTRELASSSCACLFAWAYSRTFFGRSFWRSWTYCDVWTPTITISTLLLPCMPAIGGTNNLVRFRDADTNGREDKAHGTYLPLTFPQRGTRHSVSEVYCHTFYLPRLFHYPKSKKFQPRSLTLHYQNQTKVSCHETYVPEGLCTLTTTTTIVTVTSPSQSRGAHTVSPAAAAM